MDAFAQNPMHSFGEYQSYAETKANMGEIANDIRNEVQRRPTVTTFSQLRKLVSDTLRYAGLYLSSTESRWYAQAIRGVSTDGRNSRGEIEQMIQIFKTGSSPANVSPSPFAAEFLESMIRAGKIKFSEIDGTGGSGSLSNRAATAQSDQNFLQGQNGETTGFKAWFKKN